MPKNEKSQSFDDVLRQSMRKAQGTEEPQSRYRRRKSKAKEASKPSKAFTDLMGSPPLLSDEDPAQYFALYEMLRLQFKPRCIVEEIYVRHMMDDAWLVMRYRRMNSHMLNMAQPSMGDEWQRRIDRYRDAMMGSEDLLDMRDENLILHDFSQHACAASPDNLIARQFEKRISEINLIEAMISRCMERMRRSHLTLEDFRDFLQRAITAPTDAEEVCNGASDRGQKEDAEGYAESPHIEGGVSGGDDETP